MKTMTKLSLFALILGVVTIFSAKSTYSQENTITVGTDGSASVGNTTTGYDSEGYSTDGYDKYGYNREGLDKHGKTKAENEKTAIDNGQYDKAKGSDGDYSSGHETDNVKDANTKGNENNTDNGEKKVPSKHRSKHHR